MSTASPSPFSPTSLAAGAVSTLRQSYGLLIAAVRAAGFWTAVVLPFVYLPALYSVDPSQRAFAVAGLLLLNLLSVLVGRDHV
ncbi:MAG: hypothetical protein PPP58_03515 [Natronomonas sp.]